MNRKDYSVKFGINDLWLCADCERTRNEHFIASHNAVSCAQLKVVTDDQHELHVCTFTTATTATTAADTNSTRSDTRSADNAKVASVQDRRMSARVLNRNTAGLSTNVTTADAATRNVTTQPTTNHHSQQSTKLPLSVEPSSTDIAVSTSIVQSDELESQLPANSQHRKNSGSCCVCLRIISLTSSGTIRSHGPHSNQCPGSGCVPVDGSITQPPSFGSGDGAAASQPFSITDPDSSGTRTDQQLAQQLLDIVVEARGGGRVLKYIPKASRLQAATNLSVILDRVKENPDNMDAWKQLLLFTPSCFRVTERGGKRHRSSLTTQVNKALCNFMSTDYQSQQQQPAAAAASTCKKKKTTQNELSNLAARVSAKMEEGDVHGAVRLAVSDDSLAPYDDDTVAALRLLHPPRASVTTSILSCMMIPRTVKRPAAHCLLP